MDRLFPNQVYAGLVEILRDERLYHYSKVGPDYCRLTEEGEKAVIAWVKLMGPHMCKLYETTLDARAKQLVINELKK